MCLLIIKPACTHLLSMSGLSVLVESMFSTTGLASRRRSSISAERFNRISFIHGDFKLNFELRFVALFYPFISYSSIVISWKISGDV